MHIEECKQGISAQEHYHDKENYQKNSLTTLKTLMLQDEVYKQVSGADQDQVVSYGHKLHSPNGESVDIGKIAHFYRQLESQHANLAEALVSNASLEFLKDCGFR